MFTQFTVEQKAAPRENPMKPGQVGPWSGYQRRQAHQFLKNHQISTDNRSLTQVLGDDAVSWKSKNVVYSSYPPSKDPSSLSDERLEITTY